jgi:hypothetical protein
VFKLSGNKFALLHQLRNVAGQPQVTYRTPLRVSDYKAAIKNPSNRAVRPLDAVGGFDPVAGKILADELDGKLAILGNHCIEPGVGIAAQICA